MKDSIKRFITTVILLSLSVGTAFLLDGFIDMYEKKQYPLGDADSVSATVSAYSGSYGIPEEVIYTVMKMRSGCNRDFENDGRIGYMGLDKTELSEIGKLIGIEITEEMAKNPSYNLMFGVEYLKNLYSGLGDWNAVYAALICGKESASEWSQNKELTDVTGALISLPEGHESEDTFKEYIKTEDKYLKLYFSEEKDNTKENTAETNGESDKEVRNLSENKHGG